MNNNYKNIYSYLLKNSVLNEEEILYLLYTLKYNYRDNIKDFFDILYKKYLFNYNIIEKYTIINKKNRKNLNNLLNNKKSIFLFENIDFENINFYIVLWEELHC